MTKVAKLVEVSLLVRVIVDENATEDQIIASIYPKIQDRLDNRDIGEDVGTIEDDNERPFGTSPYDLTDKETEVYDQLHEEYAKSEVVSGEMYHQIKISADYTEDEVRNGIQAFLNSDDSVAKFELKQNRKFWKIIDKH